MLEKKYQIEFLERALYYEINTFEHSKLGITILKNGNKKCGNLDFACLILQKVVFQLEYICIKTCKTPI